MIEAAMMFALGAFVSGLLALSFFGAYARRTRRVIERRLRARMAVGRAEIDAERDELRARHAVEVRRLEREIGHLRDQATAYRLDGDVKDHEISALKAELENRRKQAEDLEAELEDSRRELRSFDRNLADQASALRVARLELEREEGRRAVINEALQETSGLAQDHRRALESLIAENSLLKRTIHRNGIEAPQTPASEKLSLDRRVAAVAAVGGNGPVRDAAGESGPAADSRPARDPVSNDNAIPFPGPAVRGRPTDRGAVQGPPTARRADAAAARTNDPDRAPTDELDTQEAANIREIASQIHRLVDETAADLAIAARQRRDSEESNEPAAGEDGIPDGNLAEERRKRRLLEAEQQAAEARFMAAMDQIRSLKRADAAPGE